MSVEKRPKKMSGAAQGRSDDLTRIKGIGAARQRWFNEVLGVYTFADFANLSADAIHSQLKTGQVVSRSDIAGWMEQARQLASISKRQKAPENGWHPVASFVVEYQKNERTGEMRTAVHHMEADKTQEWPGVEHNEVCLWMVQQLGEVPAATGKPTPEIETPLSEEFQQLMARADDLLAAPPPLPQPAAPSPELTTLTSNKVLFFSEELQQIIAKADAALNTVPPEAQPLPELPEEMAYSGFSEALQQRIARAQHLATESSLSAPAINPARMTH